MGKLPSDKYIIMSDDGYWNNEVGWCCEYENATKFDYFDKHGNIITSNFPI